MCIVVFMTHCTFSNHFFRLSQEMLAYLGPEQAFELLCSVAPRDVGVHEGHQHLLQLVRHDLRAAEPQEVPDLRLVHPQQHFRLHETGCGYCNIRKGTKDQFKQSYLTEVPKDINLGTQDGINSNNLILLKCLKDINLGTQDNIYLNNLILLKGLKVINLGTQDSINFKQPYLTEMPKRYKPWNTR